MSFAVNNQNYWSISVEKLNSRARCLKITDKVSINIASKVNSVYIFSVKSHWKCLKRKIWRVFGNRSLQSNSVTRHVRLYRTKMGGKYQNTKNSNATFWVILKQCDACCIALNHFWICLNHFWIDSKAVCITFESFFERFSYLVPGWGFCAATSLFSFLALSQRDSDLTFTLMHFPGFKVTSKSLKVGPKRLKKSHF